MKTACRTFTILSLENASTLTYVGAPDVKIFANGLTREVCKSLTFLEGCGMSSHKKQCLKSFMQKDLYRTEQHCMKDHLWCTHAKKGKKGQQISFHFQTFAVHHTNIVAYLLTD